MVSNSMTVTTIVLGAGASADFGMPLGSELYKRALEGLRNLQYEWSVRNRADSFFDYHAMVGFMKADPVRKVFLPYVLSEKDGRSNINLNRIFRIISVMEKAPAYSIDTLALEYPEETEFLRTLTAREIISVIEAQISLDENHNEYRIWENRMIPDPTTKSASIANWMHLLLSMIRNSVARQPDQKFNIVSFNYDRIFEKVATAIWNGPSRKIGEFHELFKIYYPHGKIYWEIDQANKSSLSIEQSDIIFAHNKPEHFGAEESALAVGQANKLIFLGFHFSPENIQTLELDEYSPGANVIYQNYDNNIGLDRRVQEIGFSQLQKFNGPIADAILQGELGELPS